MVRGGGHTDDTETPRIEAITSNRPSDVDIVAVPAIGADPKKTWTDDALQKPWLTVDILNNIPKARVLLYDHGRPSDQDSLDSLAQKLLNQIYKERQHTGSKRPIFFICHSTGGLVAKAALVIAGRSTINLKAILHSCNGIAFLSTPHQGSSYLSTAAYAKSVRHLMQLKYHIPHQLQDAFRPRHQRLRHLSNQFRSISADMRIWTFLETVDSIISISDIDTATTVDFQAPITSTRSGILNFEHEKETPLTTDHMGTASFKGQESTRRLKFVRELKLAVSTAVDLSSLHDVPLHIGRQVTVQVNGFFEDTALGVSDETPLKLWSTKISLHDYLEKGPGTCLEDRLRRKGKIQPGSLDDSSVSSFETRQPFVHVTQSPDEESEEDIPEPRKKPVRLRPPMKRSRSSLVPFSPRIHITEAGDNYIDKQIEDSESATQSLEKVTRNATSTTGEKSEESENSDGGNQAVGLRSKLRHKISSKYKGFLPVPPSLRDRLNDNRTEVPRMAPRFDRPEPGTEKLLWIHVPYTHTGWVPKVLSKACTDTRRAEFMRNFMNSKNWYSHLIRARHLEPHARYVRPTCIHNRQNDISPTSNEHLSDDPQLALYMPYLHWDTYWNLIQRRRIVEQRLKQGRSKPVPTDISQSNLEAKLIWKYLGSEPPIHFRRTLDQFGYPNLRSTVSRDDDQMLWKRTRKTINLNDGVSDFPGMEERTQSPRLFEDGKVLMVDQLWLWVVDQKTVVTFFPNQEATTAEGKLYEQANLYNSLYNELNGDLARRFETAGDLAALIVLHCVTILLDRTLHHDLQVLRIFEESISIMTETVTKSFKRFRSRGFFNRPEELNKTSEGRLMTVAERDERDRRVAEQNRKDLSALLELRDIMDELGTIMKVLEQQTTEIKTMTKYFEDKGYGRVFIEAALSRLDEYRTQVTEMRENSHLAQKAVETLLDLKQKQANVDESRMARWQAEVTQNQSRSVMVFTVFTVIFLPLSFFTSLFGINAREWSGTQENPSIRTMLAIAGPTSVAIIVTALLLAFSERLRDIASATQKFTAAVLKDLFTNPMAIFQQGSESKKDSSERPEDTHLKNRFDKYRGSRRHQQQLEDDIWKRHEDKGILPLPSALDDDIEGQRMSYFEKRSPSNTLY